MCIRDSRSSNTPQSSGGRAQTYFFTFHRAIILRYPHLINTWITTCLLYTSEIGMETEMSVVSVIGDLNWEKHTGLEARIIETRKEMPVCMISYGSSTHNRSVLVREQDREKALVTLCKAFLDIPSEKFDVIKQTQLQDSFVM